MKVMERRKVELLLYASVCFDHCTNPFDLIHLVKKNVTADECKDLSAQIGSIIREWVELASKLTGLQVDAIAEEQEKEFAETQT